MDEQAKEIADYIKMHLGRLKSGSLRIFGDWFGGPHDNFHTITNAEAQKECLIVKFDNGEELRIWEPSRVKIDISQFVIEQATRVRWEWFYYGRPQLPANRYFLDYLVSEETIIGDTNVDWYKPTFKTSVTSPAVELV
jgi:hypothetical protein